MQAASLKNCKAEVEALGLTVKALWLTHGHLDHAGAVGTLQHHWNVPVIGPQKEDAFWLRHDWQEVSARYGFPIPEQVEVTQWLEGGEVLKLGQESSQVRLLRAIPQGHVMFSRPKIMALLWTGDVFIPKAQLQSALIFPRGNHQQLLDSFQRECFSLPDETQFISGHGPISTIGFEKQHNPFVAGQAG